MNIDGSQLLDAIAGLRVLVIGEAILDSYLEGVANRLCPEAPVPVVNLSHRRDVPGGAANTAANVASLGGRVTFLSVVGDDLEGTLLRQALTERGISTADLLTCPARQTLTKQRVIAASQMLVRLDQGSTQPVALETEQEFIHGLSEHFPRCDAVIISDYGYGILTSKVVEAIAKLQAQTPKILAVDSRHLAAYRHVGVTLVKPNYPEVLQLLGADTLSRSGDGSSACGDRPAQIAPHGLQILELTGAQIAAVTFDTEGSLIIQRGQPPYRTYAKPQPQVQAAGAGDTFLGALTLGLTAGASTPAAAELAAAAATIVVNRSVTSTCEPQALQAYFRDQSESDKSPTLRED